VVHSVFFILFSFEKRLFDRKCEFYYIKNEKSNLIKGEEGFSRINGSLGLYPCGCL
jgi:hypothetical protein